MSPSSTPERSLPRSPNRPSRASYALIVALSEADAAARAALLAGAGAGASEGVLLAALLVDTSSQVRQRLEVALAARPAAALQARPHPGYLDGAGVRVQAKVWAADRAVAAELVAGLLGYERGRELLSELPLSVEPALDDLLVEIGRSAPPQLLGPLLRLPLDLSGRLGTLLAELPERDATARRALLGGLARSTLAEGSVVRDGERSAGEELLVLWAEGLLALRAEGGLDAPSLEDFVRAGASFGRGALTRTAPPVAPATVAALSGLARALWLTLGPPAQATHPSPEAFRADIGHPSAEVRYAAWRLRLASELCDPAELVGAVEAAAQIEPGLAVALSELIAQAPGLSLTRGDARRLVALLEHERVSVRRAVVATLAASPASAALAAACLDARSPRAPLRLLAAQAPSPASASLRAYLEVERTPELTAEALGALVQPPPATWEAWPRLLDHTSSPVRRAAQEALLRLPVSERGAMEPHLVGASASLVVAVAWRFELPGQHAALEALLLAPEVSDLDARRGVELAIRYADPRAWALAWRFLVGRERTHIGGGRRARREALELLLAAPPPAQREDASLPALTWAPAGVSPRELVARALVRLSGDRDPARVRLALRWLEAGGLVTSGARELYESLGDLLWNTLGLVQAERGGRAFSAWWRRLARRVFSRRWVRPPARQRGRAARVQLLAALLDDATRRDARELYPALLVPLYGHSDPDLSRAAVRASVALLETPLPRLLAHEREQVVLEAIRVGHPDAVQAAIARELRAGLREERGGLTRGLRWAQLRPDPVQVEILGEALRQAGGEARAAIYRQLLLLASTPQARARVRAALEAEREAADLARHEGRLRGVVEAGVSCEDWELVERALPALAWAGETTRRALRDALAAATQRGHALAPAALEPLLRHPLGEVRTLAVSLLRKSGAPRPWALARSAGPGIELGSTEFSKRLLGLCEDGFEASMLLSLEALLSHPSGEVARRALKLINRQQQTLAAPVLLRHLDDPELRQPILTVFSTWARGGLVGGGDALEEGSALAGAEALEDARRALRARLALLSEGPRGRVIELLPQARAGLWSEAVAGLLAVGRHGLEEERAWVAAALAHEDPVLRRAACLAARELAPDASEAGGSRPLDALLESCARAREAPLRASARAALVARLPQGASLEPWLSDESPEVTLAALRAYRERPESLAGTGASSAPGAVDLRTHLASSDPRIRAAALRALSEGRPGDPVALEGVLRDPAPEVRREALRVVEAWGCSEATAAVLGELLSDPALAVAAAALDLVGLSLGLAPQGETSPLRQPAFAALGGGDEDGEEEALDEGESDLGDLEGSQHEVAPFLGGLSFHDELSPRAGVSSSDSGAAP